jgi:hypothetical protein
MDCATHPTPPVMAAVTDETPAVMDVMDVMG